MLPTVEPVRMMEPPFLIQRLLDGEEGAFDVDGEDVVVVLLGDVPQAGEFADSRIGHQYIQVPFFFLDRFDNAIKILWLCYIRLDTPGAGPQCLNGGVENLLAPPDNEDEGAFLDETLGRSQADAAGAACDQCDFTV